MSQSDVHGEAVWHGLSHAGPFNWGLHFVASPLALHSKVSVLIKTLHTTSQASEFPFAYPG